MAGKDIIKMSQEELKRLHVIHKAIDKVLTQAQAGELMGLCQRQVGRIVKRVKQEGDKGIIHRSRGRPSNRAIAEEIKEEALRLFKERYHDFGPTLATEKLLEIDKIKLNDETLRLWLIQKNIPYKKRKRRPHRQWRQRKHHVGEMIQMDGSSHDWFEGRGDECVFMGYIDDATGKAFGRFHPYEGTFPAMDSFKRYIKKYGIPLSIYLDKHTTYKSTKKPSIEDELNNVQPLSQFARALTELGVNVIYADSPQAKGRIERLFGTFQDRLIKEMRLRNIKTIEEANRFLGYYLPIYSKRFAVKPINDADLHRAIPQGIDLDKILCVKTSRALRNDFTIAHNRKLYQIENDINAKRVMVEERIDGSMLITHKDVNLRFKEIASRPKREQQEGPKIHTPNKAYVPAKDHPWRKFRLPGLINSKEKQQALGDAL
jgi:alkylated DNA nucleotide flippase Atl1